MSLINDALKRAHQAQPAARPANTFAGMRPVDDSRRRAGALPRYALPLVFALLCAAVYLLVHGLELQQAAEKAALTQLAAREAPQTPPPIPPKLLEEMRAYRPDIPIPPPPRRAPQDQPPEPQMPPEVKVPLASFTSSPAPPAAAESVATPKPPGPFKLQAIFYRSTRPSAVINNKNVFVGDRVAQARVSRISGEAVTLVLPGGQTVELTLE